MVPILRIDPENVIVSTIFERPRPTASPIGRFMNHRIHDVNRVVVARIDDDLAVVIIPLPNRAFGSLPPRLPTIVGPVHNTPNRFNNARFPCLYLTPPVFVGNPLRIVVLDDRIENVRTPGIYGETDLPDQSAGKTVR